MKSQDQQKPEGYESANQTNSEAARPKGVFRFKTFEEMDAWDAIYKVPIQVK
jgi:hypothetical protein